jgi:Short C-terminal domain
MGFMKKAVKYTSPAGFVAVKAAEKINDAKAGKDVSMPNLSISPLDKTTQQDTLPEGAIYQAIDHREGRNATVTLFEDRIERVKPKSRMSFQSTHQDVDMVPLRLMGNFGSQVPAFTRAEVRKANLRFSNAILHGANGNPSMSFHFKHDDASAFQAHVNRLLMQANTPAKQEVDATDKLLKLAQLRDAGVLTPEEFDARKAALIEQL